MVDVVKMKCAGLCAWGRNSLSSHSPPYPDTMVIFKEVSYEQQCPFMKKLGAIQQNAPNSYIILFLRMVRVIQYNAGFFVVSPTPPLLLGLMTVGLTSESTYKGCCC